MRFPDTTWQGAAIDLKRPVIKTDHMETINASAFRARCPAIPDRVSAPGERVVILKRGRPAAEPGPATPADRTLVATAWALCATLPTQERRSVDAAPVRTPS